MAFEETYLARTHSSDETKAAARLLAPLLRAGDVVVLEGDLGAGKTQFTQGLAAGLGIDDDVASPTFNILLEYRDGVLPLYHFDLYRLDSADDLEDIGFFETVEGDGASVIEWGDAYTDLLPDGFMEVYLRKGAGDERTLAACAVGARAEELVRAWSAALAEAGEE